jgi:hypothetical protein
MAKTTIAARVLTPALLIAASFALGGRAMAAEPTAARPAQVGGHQAGAVPLDDNWYLTGYYGYYSQCDEGGEIALDKGLATAYECLWAGGAAPWGLWLNLNV